MDDLHPFLRTGYILMAAIAGGITAQTFKKRWESLSLFQQVVGVFISASFSIFVSPLMVRSACRAMGSVPSDELFAAVVWISAAGSGVLIPACIRKLERWFATDEKESDK